MISASSNGTSLRYDPLGRLWQISGQTGTTRFLYDGDEMVGEFDAGGTLLGRYVHGLGEDDPLLWYEGANGSPYRLFSNHQGSVIGITADSGAMRAINTYDEYGIPGTEASSANIGRFRYTGQMWLREVGLYHYKARVYSPSLGRFLQIDPIGYDDQVNLYAYVENNPINMKDPTGAIGKDIFGWLAGQGQHIRNEFQQSIGDLADLPSHIMNDTTGLPPTLSGGANLVYAPIRGATALRSAVAARVAARNAELANEINILRNAVRGKAISA